MKKEYAYTLLIIIVLISGFVIKMLFINNIKDEILIESKKLKEIELIYLTDSLVQQNISKTTDFYKNNKDNKDPYGVRIGNLLGILENILKVSKIEYNENDLKPRSEMNKSGSNNLYIMDLNFTVPYQTLVAFLTKIEKEKNIIDIVSMKIDRKTKFTNDVLKNNNNSKQNRQIRVDLVIQFLKFS